MKPLILFDIDRTLFDTDNFSHLYRQKFIDFLQIPPEKLEKARTKYRLSLSKHTDHNPQEYIKHLINTLNLSHMPKIYDKLRTLYFSRDNFHRSLYPEALTTLLYLQTYYRIGIFSEGFSSIQKIKLAKSSLTGLLDSRHIYIFRRKTDHQSLAKLPADCLIVDDNIEVICDLLNSPFSSLTPIWINRKDKSSYPKARTIHSLSELI